jgi:DNA-binding NarL/FixJ family response regulator
MFEKMKVIVADDNPTFLEGLRYYLQKDKKYQIIASVSNGKELINLPNKHEADMILLDINMPELDGIQTAKNLMWHYPYLKIIAITMYQDKAYLRELIEAGFKGCVFKTELFDQLPKALETIAEGSIYFSENISI